MSQIKGKTNKKWKTNIFPDRINKFKSGKNEPKKLKKSVIKSGIKKKLTNLRIRKKSLRRWNRKKNRHDMGSGKYYFTFFPQS
jgi:hypothetical protein